MVKVRKNWKRTLAGALSLVMVLTSVYTTPVSAEETVSGGDVAITSVSGGDEKQLTSYVLDASDLDVVTAGQTAGYELSGLGDGGRFSVLFSSKTKIDSNNKNFSDGVTATKRINTQGKATTSQCSVKFSTNAAANVKVWWGCAGDGRQITILGEDSNTVTTSTETATNGSLYISEISVPSAGTYYLGGDNGSNYIFRIAVTEETSGSGNGTPSDELVEFTRTYDFRDGSIVPTNTDGKSNVSSADGNLTVKVGSKNAYAYNGAQHGVLFKDGNTIEITVKQGSGKITIGNCTYSKSGTLKVTQGGNELKTFTITEKALKCYDGTDATAYVVDYTCESANEVITLAFDNQFYCPVIKVSGKEPAPAVTEVTANVKIKDPDSLLGSSKITLVNSSDAEDVVDVTAGGTFTLASNKTYNIKTDNTDIAATTVGKTTVTTGEEAISFTIDVASTVVHPVVTIVDAGNVLGDAVITLTNTADATDVVTAKNGESVKLKIGASYLISASAASVVATVGGAKMVKATADMTTLQIDVTEADMTKHTYDVWDFGAEQLKSTELAVYNNKLDAATINGWYPGVAAGTIGKDIPGDCVAYDADGNVEFKFNAGGKTNNRLRTTNSQLTHKDDKSLKDIYDDSIVYSGYLYSNSSGTDKVNVQLNVQAGDIVTFVVSSNGKSSDITWKAPSGATTVQTYTGQSSQAQAMTFYCAESGLYTLYSATEKLVVARILRERPDTVTVSGNVTAPTGANLSGAQLVFTNETTGEVIKTAFADGKYSVSLQEQYTYAISLEGANGYIVGADNRVKLKNEAGNTTFDVKIISVELVNVTGSLADLDAKAAAALKLTLTSKNVYVPEITINAENATYSAKFEKGVTYTVTEANVEDYTLVTTSVKADADGTVDIKFAKKTTYAVNVTLEGPSTAEAAKAELTFERLLDGENGVTGELDGYVYKFIGTDNITLRNGQYKVTAVLDGYTQRVTADVKVNGAAVNRTIVMDAKNAASTAVPYKAEITVGSGKDYATVNEALEAVRNMNRENGERVVIAIEPGDYEEMLVIDVENVTLKNASSSPSIELTNKGVDIAEGAVRITSYYGHGYSYYSQGADCKYDAELLAVNRENGYASYTNPGSGTTDGSYWNATVVVKAAGFEADGIIFENSFNQYVSKKAAEDVIVKQSGAKEGTVARADMKAGDVTVQQKKYVERAAALAICNNIYDVVFDNCKFVGRQDTLYGGTGTYAEFNECSIYGGTDYIFGGMVAIFNKCDLVFNTSEDNNDVGYITAAQQKSGRGYLMYECHVTSTKPGVDTASEYPSKAGYLGRPWAAGTSEVIFFNTTIDALDAHWGSGSLIKAEGWNSSLSGESAGMCEYNTTESSGVDNSASRASWATMLKEPKTNDGVDITFEAFRREIPVVDENATEFLFESTSLDTFKSGEKKDGEEQKAGTNNYFTLLYSAKSKVEDKNKKWDDDYASTRRLSFNDKMSTTKNAIKFTTQKAATVKVWWACGADGRKMSILDSNGLLVTADSGTFTKDATYISTLKLSEAGTYYLGGVEGNNYIFKVQVKEADAGSEAPRADWSTVAAPVITGAVQSTTDKSKIDITVDANIGYDGADKVIVTLKDADGKEVGTGSSSAEKTEHIISITPKASGTYTAIATLVREGETDKVSAAKTVAFVLPLAAPYVSSATCMGGGSVSVEWDAVPEATKYIVTVDGTAISVGTSLLKTTLTGLTIGKTYTIKVVAVRGNETSEAGSISIKVVDEVQRKWSFTAYGSSTNDKNNGYIGNANDGTVTVYSENGKGKIVPGSTDGLAFYYTEIDPETENFTLTATVTVDSWKFSNGQEGFGMMVADAVGTNGDATAFWNNTYQNIATKIEYYHNGIDVTTDSSASKFSMKLGLGTIAKTGVTAADIAAIKAGTATMPEGFVSESSTLETSAVTEGTGAGTYNLIGNFTGATPTGTMEETLTTFRMEIKRNNTGYYLRYLDEKGNILGEKKYYDLERTALTQIDEDNIYVGFFASRNARITVTDIELTTIRPEDDAPAEARQWEVVYPINTIESATFATSPDYELVYYGNADGRLIITDAQENIIVDKAYTALTKERINIRLQSSVTDFLITFIPDADYRPGEYQIMSSYETVTMTHTVEYKTIANQYIYVSPDAETVSWDMDAGTREHPLDIYTAVKLAAPGQKIVLMEGTYNLESTVKVERGIDGTADNMIYMVADPMAGSRPVLDFGGLCAGMVLAGDYWYFQGFDVTHSADAQKGIQVSGSNNVLDDIRTYRNGNTGIQISRYKGTDEWEDWPANNLILNCSSYLNADKGYEDADGFAAKLTVGDGNVFDGCISAYNADDGWDLFAKVQSGSIGSVTIRNSVAYKNGYVLDANGNEVDAGNGNGFKMGGDSMPGAHVLENSIAFANKAKGIDSNSCPDIKVRNCTSFDNESYNVAFYTNTAVNTAFQADGVLSYKKSNNVAESFKLKGTQVQSDVYGVTNYYFNGTATANSAGALADDSWFVSLDTKAAIGGITRNADRTINMNGYLELTDAADANAGARMTGTPSGDVEVPVTYISIEKADPYGDASKLEEVLKDVVAATKDVTGCDTAEKLVNHLITKALQMAENNNIHASTGSLQILEVKVKVLAEVNGRMQYVDATAENFPEDGIDILLPYPNGTGACDKFSISHLVVLGCNGQTPGTMENCRYQATKDGLLVHAMSASPFIITWPEGSNDDSDGVTGGNDAAVEGTTNGTSGSTADASKDKLVASADKADSAKTDAKADTTKKDNAAGSTDKADASTDKTQQGTAKDEVKTDDKTADSAVADSAVTDTTVTDSSVAASADAAGTNVWAILIGIAVIAVIGVGVGVFVLRKKEDTAE